MWKNIRYVLYLVVLAGVFSFTYNFREYYYVPFFQKNIDKVSNSKIKFGNFSLNLPLNLSVYDIQYDKKIFIDKATLRFEPVKFLQNIKTPLKSLVALNINKIVFLEEQNNSQIISSEYHTKTIYEQIKSKLYKNILNIFNLNCTINKICVVYDGRIIRAQDINITLNKEIDIGAKIKYLNYDVKTKGNLNFDNDFITSTFYTEVDGFIKTNIDLMGFYNIEDNSFEYNINTKGFVYAGLVFDDIKSKITKNSSGITAEHFGNSVNIFAKSDENLKVWTSTGTIKIRNINDVINTTLQYEGKINNKKIDHLKIEALNSMLFGYDIGKLNFEVKNKENRIYNILCVHDSGNNFKTVLRTNGNHKTEVFNNEIKLGEITGNYKKGTISVDIRNLLVKNLPFIKKFSDTAKGRISLYGKIGSKEGMIYLKGRQLSSKNLKGFNVSGILRKENYRWTVEAETEDKKIVIKGFYDTKRKNEIDVFYNGMDSHNLMNMLGMENFPLYGTLDGTISFSAKDYITYIDAKLKNGSLFNNKFKNWNISGNVSRTHLNISTFTFRGGNTSVDMTSSIDFTKQEDSSSFNCSIKNFKINNINLNYDMNFTGKYAGNGEIAGIMKTERLNINEFTFPYEAFITLTLNNLNIKDFTNSNGLSGEINFDYTTKNINAVLKNDNSKLSEYHPDIKGRVSSVLNISGPINKPDIFFDGNVKNALYNNLLFNAKIKLNHKDDKLSITKLQLTSGKDKETTINASGVISEKKTNLNINFKGVSEEIINKYVGFRTPFAGAFYGNGTISGKFKNLKASLNLYADTLFIKTLKLNSFSAKMKADEKKQTFVIDNAKVKIADSEIKILSADFNAKTRKYNSKLKFVNTHLGPFDVFGNAKIDGKLTPGKTGSKYDGNINLGDLWLNEEKIDSLSLKYGITNRALVFKTSNNNPLNISGSINFNKYPKIMFRNILISKNDRKFSLNGTYFSEDMNFNMNGKNLDLAVLSGLFNMPMDTDGNLNFTLKTSGSTLNPDINLKANSVNGSVYHVPFDKFNVSVNVKNNNLTIADFSLIKDGKYDLSVDGYFPFWLDSSLKDKMMKKPVEVSYKLNDNNLYILNNLSENAVSTKKGSLKIDGKLTGIRKNISNVGKLSMTGKNIKTNSYINKIKDLNADIIWNKNIFTIQKAYAKAGSGVIEATGTVKMQGINPSFYNINLFTQKKGVPITVRELPIPTSGVFKMESGNFANFSKGVPTFNFKLYGNAKNPKLTGWAVLENTTFCFPSPVKQKSVEIPFFISQLLDNLYINIDLKTAANTRYENSFINMLLRGSVNLKGKTEDILANGVVISNDGLFSYLGNDFTVINSKMELINNKLFITAEGESEVYSTGETDAEIIKVYIDRSEIDNIKTRFASKNDPTMDSKKALAKLTKTDPSDTSTMDTSTDFLMKQQAIRMFSSNVATPLANTVLKKTGIVDNVRLGFVNQDTLQISPEEEASMAELLYGMKYSVEKNINRLLQVGYSVTFDKVQKEIDLKQAVEMSFRVNRNLFLKGSYGLNSDNPEYEPEKRVTIEQRIRF